ncbi:TIGR00730 family Rossman fold protein [uncultured Gemella sp.]|uniref:LOG family protein n=1 Tax=uncultured Gemella sp. TaxID=254352 RepID=UPI0028D3270A|nr:TIGR00730 family Rossman fold protein [uncultured Gemella sp.]
MKITVFCGANNGKSESYIKNATELGEWIADNNHTLVYGGGKIGLMGVIADTVLENRGEVIGIMPQFLVDREISHTGITEFIIVDDMSDRKTKLVDFGDVFIALPGGPGTLEEISQVISWVRVGKKDAPCILMNVDGYYDFLEQYFDKMVEEGFLTKGDREKTLFTDNIEEMERFIFNYKDL